MYIKTQRLNSLFQGFTERNRKILLYIYKIGIIIGIALIAIVIYILTLNLINYFIVSRGPEPPAKLIIPGVTVSGDIFLKMLPGIILVFIPHELSHKIALHLSKIKIKSMGFALIFLIPAAFVEPDEDEFKSTNIKNKLMVLTAGSYINILVALLFLPLISNPYMFYLLISPFYGPPSGVIIYELLPGYPLANQTIVDEGDVIININGIPIYSTSDLYKLHIKPGETVEITMLKPYTMYKYKVRVTAVEHPNNQKRGILGYMPRDYFPPNFKELPLYLPHTLYEIIFWIFFLSLNIGLINMLPIYVLDGYGVLSSILDYLKLNVKVKKLVLHLASIFSLALVILNLTAHLIIRLI